VKTTFLQKFVCLVAIATLAPLLTFSQTTSPTATGLISDESGAMIPGTTVTITAVDTSGAFMRMDEVFGRDDIVAISSAAA
jgi:hypothetical protein